MKDNKHPHHDLIVEWAKDTSRQLQISRMIGEPQFNNCNIETVINNPSSTVRFKPREFTKGHWYPCIDWSGKRSIYMFTGEGVCHR